MKLCRFELLASPGQVHSGIVYGPKIYETEGGEGVGTHDWSEVRLLSPIGRPPSVRLFDPPPEGRAWDEEGPVPMFRYVNPSSLFGPVVALPVPLSVRRLVPVPSVGVVIAGSGRDVPVEEADDLVLGLTLATLFYSEGDEGGRSLDYGMAIGPAITTPDEFEDEVTVDERGRRYRFSVGLTLNGENRAEFDMDALPYTIAELLSHASESCLIETGDIVAVSLGIEGQPLDKGDQIQTLNEKLGALTTRIS